MGVSTTHKQAELLAYLTRYIAENSGVAPSYEEMMQDLGLASKSGVYRLLMALEERGKIRRICNRSRAIQIIPDDLFAGIPTTAIIAELARRGEANSEARKAA